MSMADITADRLGAANIGKVLAFPVLIYLAAVMLPIGFNLGPLNLNGVRAVLLILIIPLAIRLISGRSGPLLLTDILFLLHILWLLVAMAVNNPEQTVTFFGSQTVEFVGGYLLGRVCIRNREDFIALCRLLVWLVCLTLPFAIIEAATGRALILQTLDALPGIRSERNVNAGIRFGLNRAQGSFDHPILYGLFAALILPFAFVALRIVYTTTTRYVLSFLVGLCVFFSLSGGPLMAFVIQMIMIGWAAAFDKVKVRWMLLLGFAIFCYILVDILSTRPPIRVFLHYATMSPHTAWNRLHIFNYGMDNVWANPILGLGLKDWARPSWMGESMDNFWMVQAVRYGIPGFAFIAGGYLIALWRIGRRDFDADPLLWQLRRGWMIAFVGLAFTLTTVHVWTSVYSFVFFVFGAGMWMMTTGPETGEAVAAVPKGSPAVAPHRRTGAAQSPSLLLHKQPRFLGYTRFPSREREKF